jgi:hypothetical protein
MAAFGGEVKDTQYGYAMSLPSFGNLPAGGAAIRLSAMAPAEDGFAANVGVMVQERKTTRDEYIAVSRREFGSAGLTVRSMALRQVSGHPAVLFDYEGQMGGRALHFLGLAVVLPNRVLLVTGTSAASAFAKHKAEFERVIDSFALETR